MSRFASAIICLLPILFLTACATPGFDTSRDEAVVFVIERGWHTDIGLPVEEIRGPLKVLATSFPGVRFLTFGFGERQFVVNHEKSITAMLSALLPSSSVLLMTALRSTPETAFGRTNVVALRLSRAGLDRLEASIWEELERSPAGEPIPLADGPYPGSVFYAAHDTYDGLYTCNTWTAEMLRAGGLPMPSAGVLFAGQVMGMARWIGAHHATPRY